MRVQILAVVAIALLMAARDPVPPTGSLGPDTKNSLDGAWAILSMNQQDTTIEIRPGGNLGTFLFEGSRFTLMTNQVTQQGTIELDLTKAPPILDWLPTKGMGSGKRWPGIFKQKGDILTVCYATLGNDRPKRLVPDKAKGQFVLTCKRLKS